MAVCHDKLTQFLQKMTKLTPQQQLLLETYQDTEANLARAKANLDRAVDNYHRAIKILDRAKEIRRRASDLRIEAMRCCGAAGFSIHEHLGSQDDA